LNSRFNIFCAYLSRPSSSVLTYFLFPHPSNTPIPLIACLIGPRIELYKLGRTGHPLLQLVKFMYHSIRNYVNNNTIVHVCHTQGQLIGTTSAINFPLLWAAWYNTTLRQRVTNNILFTQATRRSLLFVCTKGICYNKVLPMETIERMVSTLIAGLSQILNNLNILAY